MLEPAQHIVELLRIVGQVDDHVAVDAALDDAGVGKEDVHRHVALERDARDDRLVGAAAVKDEAQTLAAFLDNGGRVLVACGADTPLSRLTQLQAVCSLYGLGFQSGWVVESAAESDRYVDAPEYLSPVVAADYEITGRILLPRASALITPALRPGVTVTPLLTTSDRAVLHPDASGNALDSQAGDVSGHFLLGAMAKKGSGTALSLLASSDMLRDSAAISGASVLDASDNLALLTDLVTDMADNDQTASLDAGVKRLPAQRITFDSESSRQRVTILALTLIPGVLLLTMAVVLLKRRRL